MLIKDLSVNNKCVNIKNVKFNFEKCGLYFIRGDNGSGKTTLLRSILYDKYDVRFQTESQQSAYEANRCSLFAYVPQDISSMGKTIREFLVKDRKDISDETLIQWLNKFQISYSSLNSSFDNLSGGEKRKCGIISALLKDTPYIFMDEPTNDLDDVSVQILCSVILDIISNRTIIIVSHDERITVQPIAIYQVSRNEVVCEPLNDNCMNNKKPPSLLKVQPLSLLRKINKNFLSVVVIFFVCAILLFFIVYNNLETHRNYSNEEVVKNDIICTYNVEYEYGELNKEYCQYEKIEIAEESIDNLITYSDVKSINNMTEVKWIVLSDNKYISDINQKCADNTLGDTLNYMTLPEVVTESYSQLYDWYFDVTYLKEGTFPKDFQNEVVISENLLKKYFLFSDSDINNAIGQSIELNGKKMEIVGIHYYDICFISLDLSENYGYYIYDSETYSTFVEEQTQYKLNVIDTFAYNYVDTMLIYCKENMEKVVLDQLIQLYPATNYTCYSFSNSWVTQHNRYLFAELLLKNLIFGFIMGIIMLGTTRYITKSAIINIEEYSCYYLNRRKMKRAYLLSNAIGYVFLSFLGLCLLYIISTYASFIMPLYILVCMLLIIPTVIYYIIYSKKWEEQ